MNRVQWFVYILQCSDGTLYTGITTELKRRIEEHNSSLLGAKYTRGKRPVRLVYSKKVRDKAAASKEEYQIKKLTRKEKLKLTKKSS
jgi:putative endonuclease